VAARRLLDRVLEDHPTAPGAGIARLNRSVVAIREGRTHEAARDLRALAHSDRRSLPQERRLLLDALTTPGRQAGPEYRLLLTNRYEDEPMAEGRAGHEGNTSPSDTAGALERFAAPFLDGGGDPEITPRVLHGLVFAAAEDQSWPEVQTLSSRLADRFPGYPSAPDVLTWVAGRATSAKQWPIVRSSYEHLLALGRNGALTPQA
jgi:hypothetical protein